MGWMSPFNLTGSCRRNRQVNPVTGGKMLFAGAGLAFLASRLPTIYRRAKDGVRPSLTNQWLQDLPADISQFSYAPSVLKCEPFIFQSHKMKDGGMHIADVNGLID